MLARQHTAHGIVYPKVFIPAAEKEGWIHELRSIFWIWLSQHLARFLRSRSQPGRIPARRRQIHPKEPFMFNMVTNLISQRRIPDLDEPQMQILLHHLFTATPKIIRILMRPEAVNSFVEPYNCGAVRHA